MQVLVDEQDRSNRSRDCARRRCSGSQQTPASKHKTPHGRQTTRARTGVFALPQVSFTFSFERNSGWLRVSAALTILIALAMAPVRSQYSAIVGVILGTRMEGSFSSPQKAYPEGRGLPRGRSGRLESTDRPPGEADARGVRQIVSEALRKPEVEEGPAHARLLLRGAGADAARRGRGGPPGGDVRVIAALMQLLDWLWRRLRTERTPSPRPERRRRKRGKIVQISPQPLEKSRSAERKVFGIPCGGLGIPCAGFGIPSHPNRRSIIMPLMFAIALAGFRPLGQVFAQFMIVWQR
jgi:hypothetical protein